MAQSPNLTMAKIYPRCVSQFPLFRARRGIGNGGGPGRSIGRQTYARAHECSTWARTMPQLRAWEMPLRQRLSSRPRRQMVRSKRKVLTTLTLAGAPATQGASTLPSISHGGRMPLGHYYQGCPPFRVSSVHIRRIFLSWRHAPDSSWRPFSDTVFVRSGHSSSPRRYHSDSSRAPSPTYGGPFKHPYNKSQGCLITPPRDVRAKGIARRESLREIEPRAEHGAPASCAHYACTFHNRHI